MRILNFLPSDAAALGQAQVGSVYVFEYKIRINEITNGSVKNTSWWSYAGVAFDNGGKDSKGNPVTGIKEDYFALAINGINGSSVANVHSNSANLALTPGEWLTVREEIRLTAYDASTGKYTAQISTYMNGYSQAISTSNKTLKGNVLCAGFQFRSVINGGYGHLDKINIDFDDIVLSAYNTLPIAQ